MGFEKAKAKQALERSKGDLSVATAILLGDSSAAAAAVPAHISRTRQAMQQSQESELQAAMRASLAQPTVVSGVPIPQGLVTGNVVAAQPLTGSSRSGGGGDSGGGGGVAAYNDRALQQAIAASESISGARDPLVPKPIATASSDYEEQLQQAMKDSEMTASADFDRRAVSLRVPTEPEDGASGSTWIFVRIGEETIKRRFWSDNSLNDVFNFVLASPSTFREHALAEIQIVNTTTYPPSVLDIPQDGSRTLQSLELWPSGRLCVQVRGSNPDLALPPAPDPTMI